MAWSERFLSEVVFAILFSHFSIRNFNVLMRFLEPAYLKKIGNLDQPIKIGGSESFLSCFLISGSGN